MTITIETRLEKKDNQQLIGYVDSYIAEYNSICRYVWKILIGPPSETKNKKSKLNTHLQHRFNISKRTANSIIADMKGRLASFKELKAYEIKQLETNIKKLEKDKANQKAILDYLKKKCIAGTISTKELNGYKFKREKYFHLSNKLNKKKQKLAKVKTDLSNEKFSLCFGSKSFFKKQYFLEENGFKSHIASKNAFIRNRDKNIYFVGSKDESYGNQEFQLNYDEVNDEFTFKIRKQSKYENGSKYVTGSCDFPYMKDYLIEIVQAHKDKDVSNWQAITYRIKKRGKKYYIQAIFELKEERFVPDTCYKYGVFGLDFNENFIEVCETNQYGHMVSQKRYDLPKKENANKSLTAMQEVASQICKIAYSKGKDVVIENLNFKSARAKIVKATSKKGKRYNKMLSFLDYSRYKQCLESACFKNKVSLTLINPAYSSKNGRKLYCQSMKLSVHQAASFVIAHRGQQLAD